MSYRTIWKESRTVWKVSRTVWNCLESVQNYLESVQNCLESVQNFLESVQNCLDSVQKCLESVQKCLESVQNCLESVQNCFENIQNCLVLKVSEAFPSLPSAKYGNKLLPYTPQLPSQSLQDLSVCIWKILKYGSSSFTCCRLQSTLNRFGCLLINRLQATRLQNYRTYRLLALLYY